MAMSSNSTSDDALPVSVFERIFRSYRVAGFLPVLLTVLLVAFALFVPNFVAVQNLLNVLRSSSYLVIIAAGQMLVLIVGGFDLSQGAVVALTSVSSALVMVAFKDTFANEPGLIILVGVLAGLGCGAIVGLVNGVCVAFLRISPFMVTLGTMSIATGFALLLTSGIPVYGMPKSYVEGFGRGLWLDLPTAFYLAAAVVAVIWVMQNYTRMGRYILAIGGHMQAGVSIKGGVGRVEMVALGAILLLTLTDAMDLLRIDPRIQAIFLGIIVVLAVALDEFSQRRAALV
jgi:ribose transport system permease protein